VGGWVKLRLPAKCKKSWTKIPPEKLAEKLFDKKIKSPRHDGEEVPDVLETLVNLKKSEILDKATQDGVMNWRTVLRELDNQKLSPEIKKLMFDPGQLKKIDAARTWFDALPPRVNPSRPC